MLRISIISFSFDFFLFFPTPFLNKLSFLSLILSLFLSPLPLSFFLFSLSHFLSRLLVILKIFLTAPSDSLFPFHFFLCFTDFVKNVRKVLMQKRKEKSVSFHKRFHFFLQLLTCH